MHNLRIFSREEVPEDLLKNIRLGGDRGEQQQHQDIFANPNRKETNEERSNSRGGRGEAEQYGGILNKNTSAEKT